jgi:glutamate carboxypeptidase
MHFIVSELRIEHSGSGAVRDPASTAEPAGDVGSRLANSTWRVECRRAKGYAITQVHPGHRKMTLMRDLLDFCDARRDWLRDTITTLARHESPSTDKAALDACAGVIDSLCRVAGGRVTRLPRQDAGDHLLVEFGCGERQLLLLAHYDTVWPVGQLARMPVEVRDGRLFGPGVYDMKAGLVMGLLALQACGETGPAPAHRLVFLITSDEEVGSHTSRAAIEEEARRSEAVFVLEPALADGRVKTSRKGVGVFTLRARGISAHAGVDPGKGASAIHELARQVTAIAALADPARGVSVNVGLIAGGTRSNVIAEEAWAEVDVRVPTREDAVRVETALRGRAAELPGTYLEVTGGINRPPMERTPAVIALFERARDLAARLGFVLGEGGTGGASDGNFTGALGVPTLDGLGALGDGAHALHEHVVLDELPRRAALLAGLLREGVG